MEHASCCSINDDEFQFPEELEHDSRDTLVSDTTTPAATTTTPPATTTTTIQPDSWSDPDRMARFVQRTYIAKEILSSEKSFMQSLLILKNLFMERFIKNQLLDERAITDVFSNLDDIISINSELLKLLKDRISNWNWESCLGDIFESFSHFFRVYSIYYANYSNALAVISSHMSRNSKFSEFLKQMSSQPECHGLRFDAFLMTPIQRIPRYRLLLLELFKYTDSDHLDYPKLKKSVYIIEQVAEGMNEKVKQHEMFIFMLNIQRSLVGYKEVLLTPGRRFIHRGQVTKICRGSNQPRQLILFSDILIYARVISPSVLGDETHSSSILHFRQKIYLDGCYVVDLVCIFLSLSTFLLPPFSVKKQKTARLPM